MSSKHTPSHSLKVLIEHDEVLFELSGLPVSSNSLEAMYLKVMLVQYSIKINDLYKIRRKYMISNFVVLKAVLPNARANS